MVYRMIELIPPSDVAQQSPEGFWFAAHPMRFMPPIPWRVRAAWAVLRGQAIAVARPISGEFEMAMEQRGWRLGR
jgi:hypothetical protein